ncbi:HAUS augmin-like complex subunit 4 [Diadema setosum]|uniref:HAUS augmin-like complex subunit 4 n=1 Tax=Diadema setosum TaxID=31175 RepID=UPI003B3AD47B
MNIMDYHNNKVIKVNMSLPVHLMDSDAEQNPGLHNLLQALGQHLTADGTSKHVEESCKQARESLEREKTNYLQHHILHHELHKVLMDHSVASQDMAPDSKSAQFYEAVQRCLGTAEACDFLHSRPVDEENVTLLGLDRDKLLAGHHQKKVVSMLQPQLIPLMEDHLRKKCEEIQSFHETESNATEGEDLTFAKATQLPDVLRSEKTKLEDERRQLKLDRLLRNKQCWQYYQVLKEALHTLEKLITNHRLRLQADRDSITTDWLSARCQAMHLKIKVFEAKLLCSTYTPEVVKAQRVARQHLEGAIQERETDCTRHAQALRSYEALGMGFDELVTEYQQLRSAIDNKRWALRELRQSLAEENTGDLMTLR